MPPKMFALGTAIENSQIFTATLKLINDVTKGLLILLPVICILLIIVFMIMRVNASEQEQPVWTKRAKGVAATLIIGWSATGLVALLTSYYGGVMT